MEKNETPKNLALLTADEVTLSILEVDAEGVRIKLWPDVNAVRAHLEECCERMPGGRAGYSVRHYVCGRYLYCAVALADITKDAPCPSTYRVSSDAPTNEADGSFLAAAAAWSIGAGVLNLPPLRIPASKVHIVPQGKPGTNIIERYVLDDALTLDDITYNGDGSVASLRVRMDCIKCNSSQVRVIDTRAKGTRRIYRRRVCMMCGCRWTTVELPVGDVRQAVDAVNGLEERHGKKHTAKR